MTGTSGYTRWCNKHFALKNFDVIGQTDEEYFDMFCLYDDNKCNDDCIRNACLYYKDQCMNLFLASDDINLGHRAIVSNVDTLSSEKLPEIVENLSISQNNITIDVPFKKSSKTHIGCIPSQIFESIRFSLTSNMTDIFQHHMKNMYGDIWKQIVSD